MVSCKLQALVYNIYYSLLPWRKVSESYSQSEGLVVMLAQLEILPQGLWFTVKDVMMEL